MQKPFDMHRIHARTYLRTDYHCYSRMLFGIHSSNSALFIQEMPLRTDSVFKGVGEELFELLSHMKFSKYNSNLKNYNTPRTRISFRFK